MKIEITKNEYALIGLMNVRVNAAAQKLATALEVSREAQAALNDFLKCKALDAGSATGTGFERTVISEEDGKHFLTLCAPEKTIS